MASQVPNIFVEQYDQGQKKIRADLMDENFAYVCDQIDTQAGAAQTAADNAQTAADSKTTPAEAAAASAPASGGISLTIPASGGSVVAPGPGYITFRGIVPANTSVELVTNAFWAFGAQNTVASRQNIFIPVDAGRSVVVKYPSGITQQVLSFVALSGSNS